MDEHTVITSNEVLENAISYLGNTIDDDGKKFTEQIQLLTIFAKKMLGAESISKDVKESWLNKVVLQFWFPFTTLDKELPKPEYSGMMRLLQTCCLLKEVQVVSLNLCADLIKTIFNNGGVSENGSVDIRYVVAAVCSILDSSTDETVDKEVCSNLFKICIELFESEAVAIKDIQMINVLLHKIMMILPDQKENLWSCILSLGEKEDKSKPLILLTSQLTAIASCDILKKSKFWMFIQEGLVHTDPLTRKRSLYLLKWAIDLVSKTGNFLSESRCEIPLMFWCQEQHEELWNVWKTIVLIMESLEEKQLHMIEPFLASFDDVLLASKKGGLVHFSWLNVMLHRTLTHESKPLVKWAVQFSLQLPSTSSSFPLLLDEEYKFIFQCLFPVLQGTFLYSNEEDQARGSKPAIVSMLTSFLQDCTNLHPQEKKLQFCLELTKVVTSLAFNDISLVYITEAMSQLSVQATLPTYCVEIIKSFLISKLRIIRKQYQLVIFHNLLVYLLKNMALTAPSLDLIIKVVAMAFDSEMLMFNGNCWHALVQWCQDQSLVHTSLQSSLKQVFNEKVHGKEKEIVPLLLLYCQFDGVNLEEICSPVTDVVSRLNSHPYLDTQKIAKVLGLVAAILNVLQNGCDRKCSASLITLLENYSSQILPYIFHYLQYSKDTLDNLIYWNACKFLDCYASLLKCSSETSVKMLSTHFNKLIPDILTHLKQLNFNTGDNKENLSLAVKAVKLTHFLSKCFVDSILNVSKVISLIVNFLIHFDRQHFHNFFKQVQSEVINCDVCAETAWDCLSNLLNYSGIEAMNQKNCLLDVFFNDIDLASFSSITSLVAFAPHFMDMFPNDREKLISVINLMWKVGQDLVPNDHSYIAIQKYCIATIFHKKMLVSECKEVKEILVDMLNRFLMLGEKKVGVVNILVEQCTKVWKELQSEERLKSLHYFLKCTVSLCVYGSLHRKHERPYINLNCYLSANRFYDADSFMSSQDQNVRVCFINFILSMDKGPAMDSYVLDFIKELLNYEKDLSKPKQMYYPNSLTHRYKLRVWQMILILLSKLSSHVNQCNLLPLFYDTFIYDNQPSIRFYIEWCILIVIFNENSSYDTLWAQLEAASEKKILSVTTIFSICIQLIKFLDEKHFCEFASEAIPKLLPWAHAQHMTSRIHAQVALQLMWQNIQDRKLMQLEEKFSLLGHFFSLKEHNTAAVKHRENLMQSFFLSGQFHPINHYSLQYIFHEFLKYTGTRQDECIMAQQFQLVEQEISSKAKLKHYNAGRECPQDASIELASLKIDSSKKQLVDMQKKIMPWRVVPPSDDAILQAEFDRKNESDVSELILCATLVEKIPNLGGLCRTAEIFGVKTLTVAARQYLNDQNFKSLSVTAEKWIDIEQVMPIKLQSWLLEKKNEGYRLIGVEQTANSKKIGQYQFPKKSLLLLGNEKTGIPVDLIQVLDDCVEIPQYGVIRSLNVHISGAIMVWEYSKQHMFEKSEP